MGGNEEKVREEGGREKRKEGKIGVCIVIMESALLLYAKHFII